MVKRDMVLIIILTWLVMLCGCAFFEGLIGTSDTQDKINELIIKAEETGSIDMLEVVTILKQMKQEQMPWYEWILYMVGVSAGTYLGTRRIRKSPLGDIANKVLGVFNKSG